MDKTDRKTSQLDDLPSAWRQVVVRYTVGAAVLLLCAHSAAEPPRVTVRAVRELPLEYVQAEPQVKIGEVRELHERPASALQTDHGPFATLSQRQQHVGPQPPNGRSFPGSEQDDALHPPPFFDPGAFSPDPNYDCVPYDPARELATYTHKWCNPNQRPIVELFRGLYRKGEIPPSWPVFTETNPITKHFLVFGDFRTAVAYNDNGGDDQEFAVWANRLNLDFDLKLTATERIHAFWGPLDQDGRFTRAEFRDENGELIPELDEDFDTLFFEGDLGYIWGGFTNQWAPFDLPFVAGKYPLLFQNGTWMVDAIEGFSFAIPAKNNAFFDWSNYDITFFFGFDDIDSPAFGNNDNAAEVYGFKWFLDAYNGYVEIGYAFLNDQTGQGLSYSNVGLAYTRRYFNRVSNSTRVIINTGQSPNAGQQTADGAIVLFENAFITSAPNYFVPYVNLFAGFDRPQSVARAAGTGGILLNTGINFETDGLTGFPTLDATANNTYGGAFGVNLLGPDFTWQLIMEFATVQVFGDDANRNAAGDQYGFGMRFQVPINFAWLMRFDAMYGLFEDAPDVRGARAELRWKF